VEQYGQLVVECHGLLTGAMRGFMVLETLVKIGLAFGTVKLLCCVVFLVHGRIGFAFSLMQHREEGAQRVEILRPPQGHVAGGVRAGHEAQPPIRGQAKAEEMVVLKRFKMRLPGVSRTI
jgi:hypothetical protein